MAVNVLSSLLDCLLGYDCAALAETAAVFVLAAGVRPGLNRLRCVDLDFKLESRLDIGSDPYRPLFV